jgi:rod shape-determining protein MreC
MFKRPYYIALILVVLFVAVLSRLPSQTLGNLKLAIGGMFLPLFGLANSSHHVVEEAGKHVVPRSQLIQENDQLRRINQELIIRLQQEEAVWHENERLRLMMGSQKRYQRHLKLAHVVTRDPANWWRSVQIDLGSRDGLTTNLAVLTCDGLVGRVLAVGDYRSQVLLLGDPNLRVAARIDGSREAGIIMSSSSSPQENGMVDMGYLPGSSSAKPGQIIKTSGEGGIFPADIPIGQIVDLRKSDYGITREARIKLFANLSALEEVWVMLP